MKITYQADNGVHYDTELDAARADEEYAVFEKLLKEFPYPEYGRGDHKAVLYFIGNNWDAIKKVMELSNG